MPTLILDEYHESFWARNFIAFCIAMRHIKKQPNLNYFIGVFWFIQEKNSYRFYLFCNRMTDNGRSIRGWSKKAAKEFSRLKNFSQERNVSHYFPVRKKSSYVMPKTRRFYVIILNISGMLACARNFSYVPGI